MRDDDPPHPNFSGIVFTAATDRQGVVIHPATGQTSFPMTYMTLDLAQVAADELDTLIGHIREIDPRNYLADHLETIAVDFAAAVADCEKP